MAEQDDGEARTFGFPPLDSVAASEQARMRRLLQRVAEALQVTEASLYGAGASLATLGAEQAGLEADLEVQCAALLHAFRHVRDPEERRRLLAIVQAASERG